MKLILDKYYDPLYKHSYCGKIDTVVEFDSIEEAKKRLWRYTMRYLIIAYLDTMLQ